MTTPLDPEDPQLTAHVLGELPPAESVMVEMACWRDPALRDEVEHLRVLTEQLAFAFAAEEKAGLTPAQQRVILKNPPVPPAFPEQEVRLTACALGELPPAQADAMATRLADDRAASLEVELTGVLGSIVKQSFAHETPAGLTEGQREEIRSLGERLAEEARNAPAGPRVQGRPEMARRPRTTPAPLARRNQRRFSWPRVMKAAAAITLAGTLGYSLAPGSRSQWIAWWAAFDFNPSPRGKTPAEPSAAHPAETRLTVERLLALIESELNRPAAVATSLPIPATLPSAEATPSAAATMAETKRDTATEAPGDPPRRQPDASLLPPSLAGVAREIPQTAPLQATDPGKFLLASRNQKPLQINGFYNTARADEAILPATLGRASYDVMRQFVRDFALPPPADLVRPEEIINQFDYDAHPAPGQDFGVAIEAATCPWNEKNQLVRVTVAARESIDPWQPLRLTFALRVADTAESERTQLLFWQGLQALLPRLRAEDTLAIVVWGKSQGLVLPPTGGWRHETIRDSVARWQRGGPVAPGGDWPTVLSAMRGHHDPKALNRCLIVTDGPLDFVAPPADLALGASQSLDGIGGSLAVARLGPRRGDVHRLAVPVWQADSSAEAARLFSREVVTPLPPVAENVQIDVRFFPHSVKSWRPIGFGRGAADATEDGAHSAATGLVWRSGHQVTGLYEVTPQEPTTSRESADGKKDEAHKSTTPLSVHVRWNPATTNFPREMKAHWASSTADWRSASWDFRFAAGAAAFALKLSGDPSTRALSDTAVEELVTVPEAADPFGLRREFAALVKEAGRSGKK